MPFKVQEIMDRGGIYFGENAISHNLIMCNKANLLNQASFRLGVPGSGKSDRRLPRQRTNTAPEGHLSRQHPGTAPEGRLPRQRTSAPSEGQPPHQRPTTAPDRRLPRQRTDAAPKQPRPKPFKDVIDRRRPRVHAETERPADTADTVAERGRAFVKKRFETWAERRRQEKKRAVQSGRPAQPQGKAPDVAGAPRQAVKAAEHPVETVKQSGRTASQTVKSTGRAAERMGRNTVKSAQRTIKTTRQAARGTVKTAERTSKTTIKTAKYTAKAAQKTAQATARAARVTAQAVRATAKTAATAAKASAKAVSATVKTVIASVKALVAAIAAGGWIAILAIVVICLIGLIAGSCFGTIFSGEDSGAAARARPCLRWYGRSTRTMRPNWKKYIVLAGVMSIKWSVLYKMTGTLWMGLDDHLFNNVVVTNLLHVVSNHEADNLQIVRIMIGPILSFTVVMLCYRKAAKRTKQA